MDEREARNAYMRAWKKKNKDKVNASNQKWKDANRELVRGRERGYAKKAYKKDPEKYRKIAKEYRDANLEVTYKAQAAWRSKNKDYLLNRALSNVALYLWENAGKRARQKGREFTITVADISVPECCPVLGFKLEIQTGMKAYNSPSLDRIDSTKGYIPGNVKVISMRANWLKSNGTVEEFERIITYMKSI